MMVYSGPVMLVFATLMSLSSARAVNISNTWMLPEEGFPVFYRYFRDRISWYEADAVCQFHHANLVTADSSSQYDAIRAYLKELDITENIWIGLAKASDKPNFTWTDFHPLTGEGHWQEAIPKGSDPMCVTMDPAADFLWKSMSCGGPEVASFICELPIPSWALGPTGCLLTELPSLTVLYIPEQSAVELTSDCGLDGTKRIACKGNADREEILKQLTCAILHYDFDEKSTKPSVASSTAYETSSDENSLNGKTTKTWIWTSNTVDIDYGMPTRHRRETEDTLSPVSTKSTTGLSTAKVSYKKKSVMPESFITPTTSYYKTEITTNFLENDSTLDSSRPKVDDKFTRISETRRGLTTQRSRPEEQAEMLSTLYPSTADSKIIVTDIDDTTSEYSSVINQGQLFSIIENGTMFDIIELNDSNPDISRTQQNTSTSIIRSELKEVTTQRSFTTNTDPKKYILSTIPEAKSKKNKKNNYQDFGNKKSSPKISAKGTTGFGEKHVKDELVKEVELYPIIKDTSIKLNRTFRKELPPILKNNNKTVDGSNNNLRKSELINLSINNDLSYPESEHIKIKLKEGRINNITETLFIADSNRKHLEDLNDEIELNHSKSTDILNAQTKNFSIKIHQSEDEINFSQNKDEVNRQNVQEHNSNQPMDMKKKFLPKSLLSESTTGITIKDMESDVSQNPLDADGEEQPRPNRQRQLTRPQRRSFYPYFFSRVLG